MLSQLLQLLCCSPVPHLVQVVSQLRAAPRIHIPVQRRSVPLLHPPPDIFGVRQLRSVQQVVVLEPLERPYPAKIALRVVHESSSPSAYPPRPLYPARRVVHGWSQPARAGDVHPVALRSPAAARSAPQRIAPPSLQPDDRQDLRCHPPGHRRRRRRRRRGHVGAGGEAGAARGAGGGQRLAEGLHRHDAGGANNHAAASAVESNLRLPVHRPRGREPPGLLDGGLHEAA
mmetsp:Transcript_29135/g.73841  ORF Transcript_29135/g.73841 Transcript_29135/m.73841 type:complete len:230 (-) Transcript_29135:178-867(-)